MPFTRAFFIVPLLVLLPALPAIAGKDAPDEETMKSLAWPRDLEKYREELPEGYSLEIERGANHDRITAITPRSPEGEIDGIKLEKRPFNRSIMRATPFKNGVRHGVELVYKFASTGRDRQHHLAEKTPWVNGQIHGDRVRYHPNGEVMSRSTYVEGEVHGKSVSYDEEGNLIRESTFKNGNRHGKMIEYWSHTGEKRREIDYTNGRVDGKVTQYHDNGKLRRVIPLQNEVRQGVQEEYDMNGELRRKVYWIDNDRVSESRYLAWKKQQEKGEGEEKGEKEAER